MRVKAAGRGNTATVAVLKGTAALAKEAGMSERTYQQRRNIIPRDMIIPTSGVPDPIGPAQSGIHTLWPNFAIGAMFSEVRIQNPAYTRSDRLRNAPIGTPSTGPAATGVCALDGYAGFRVRKGSWFSGRPPVGGGEGDDAGVAGALWLV